MLFNHRFLHRCYLPCYFKLHYRSVHCHLRCVHRDMGTLPAACPRLLLECHFVLCSYDMVWPHVFVDHCSHSNRSWYWLLPHECWLRCCLRGPLDLVSHQLGCWVRVAWHCNRRYVRLVCTVMRRHGHMDGNLLCITWCLAGCVNNSSLRLGGYRVRLHCAADVCVHCSGVHLAMGCVRCFSSVVLYSSMFRFHMGYDRSCVRVSLSQLFAAVRRGTEELHRCSVVALPQAMLALHMACHRYHSSNSMARHCFCCLQYLD